MPGVIRFARFGFQKSRLERITTIDRMLKGRGMPPVSEMAKRFNVSCRTIERDLRKLQEELGVGVIKVSGNYPFRYSEKTATILPFNINEGELFHFLLGESALRQYRGSPFEKTIKKAYQKIVNYVLDEDLKCDISLLCDTFHFDPGPITVQYDPAVFKTVLRGLREKQTLKISYFSAYTRKNAIREIDPYHIANRSGDWYVLAFCHLKNTVRMFHIGRIKEAKITEKEFEILSGFDARAHIEKGFGIITDGKKSSVKIKFSPETAVYIKDKEWHQGQTIKKLSDGSVVLSFVTEGLDAVKRWVLSFGSEAVVLEPEQLIEAVVKEGEKIRKLYKNSSKNR